MSEYTLSVYQNIGAHIFRPNGTAFPLVDSIDELNALLARAKAAEEERDELKRKLSEATSWPAKPAPVTTLVETISAEQAKASAILVNTLCPQPDWQRVRIDAAIAALQGIVSNRANSATIAAEWAIDYANVLVAELKKEVAE